MFTIRLDLFKKIINVSKAYLSKDSSRRFLGYIRMEAYKDNRLVVYALDGYRAVRIFVAAQKGLVISEDCKACIKPINFEVLKDLDKTAQISVFKGETEVVIPTRYGKTTYVFDDPAWNLDVDKIFDTPREAEEDWCCSPYYLQNIGSGLGTGRVYISIPKNRLQPAVFYSGDENMKVEQLLLPIRGEKRDG